MELTWDLGEYIITSNTSYWDYTHREYTNYDYTNFAVVVSDQGESGDSVTQELRLQSNFDGNFNFMVGAFYEDMFRDLEAPVQILPESLSNIFGANTSELTASHNTISSVSLTTKEGATKAMSVIDGALLMISGIREIEESKGSGGIRELSQGEMINRENLGKSLVASRNLKKGDILNENDIKVLSPGQGLSPQKYNDLLGRTLNHNMDEEDFFYPSDLSDHLIEPRAYKFDRPWGVPVPVSYTHLTLPTKA